MLRAFVVSAIALTAVAKSAAGQLITAVDACRVNDAGSIVIFGRTTLPDGTALTISALSREATVFVTGKGTFAAASFGDSHEPSPVPSVAVRIASQFTAESQPKSVLSKTGVGGNRLARNEKQLVPDDAAAPNGRRHLDVTAPVALAPFVRLSAPVTIANLVILPVPFPDSQNGYALNATFVVDVFGNGTLLDWNRPDDTKWGEKVFKALLGYRFRPARRADGTPACGLTVVRARVFKP
jgi:hypothetical protein